MPRWTYYTAPGTCALATHIALCEADADFDLVKLDFSIGQQQSPEYLAINPKGRVPALKTERGVLTETPALLAFVAQAFPAARLAPLDDPYAFARMQELASYLASTVWNRRSPDPGWRANATAWSTAICTPWAAGWKATKWTWRGFPGSRPTWNGWRPARQCSRRWRRRAPDLPCPQALHAMRAGRLNSSPAAG